MSEQSPEERQRFMDGMARAEELVDKMKTTRDPNIINKLNQELMAVLDSIKDIVPDEELPDSP